MVGIYKITNIVSGHFYIGQSVNIKRRFVEHMNTNKEPNIPLRRAVLKYGKENFELEVLEECKKEDLNEREIFYIKALKPQYNISTGGCGSAGVKLTPLTKEILRNKAKRQWEMKTSDEKEKTIKHLTGPPVGHPVSQETREKLRIANLGKKQSPETIEKRKQTIKRNKDNGYIRMNKGHYKKVICTDTNEVFESVKAAAESIGAKPTSVSSVLKGRYQTCRGKHFEYLKV